MNKFSSSPIEREKMEEKRRKCVADSRENIKINLNSFNIILLRLICLHKVNKYLSLSPVAITIFF
jgi:hypothetical protein